MLVSCCTNSTNYHNSYSYLLVQQRAVYNYFRYTSTSTITSNPLEPPFQT